jgi:hypothetical protein
MRHRVEEPALSNFLGDLSRQLAKATSHKPDIAVSKIGAGLLDNFSLWAKEVLDKAPDLAQTRQRFCVREFFLELPGPEEAGNWCGSWLFPSVAGSLGL